MRILATSIIALYMLGSPAAAQSPKEIAMQRVKSRLANPASAEFQDVILGEKAAVCGKVRAKNALGTYADYRYFVSMTDMEPNFTYIEGVGEVPHIFLNTLLPKCGIHTKIQRR